MNLHKKLDIHFCSSSNVSNCISTETRRLLVVSFLASFINTNEEIFVNKMRNSLEVFCAMHNFNKTEIMAGLKQHFESNLANKSCFSFLLKYQNDDILSKRRDLEKSVVNYFYHTWKPIKKELQQVSILFIFLFSKKYNYKLRNCFFFEILFQEKIESLYKYSENLFQELKFHGLQQRSLPSTKNISKNEHVPVMSKERNYSEISNYDHLPNQSKDNYSIFNKPLQVTCDLAKQSKLNNSIVNNPLKVTCTCRIDNFCLCEKYKGTLKVPFYRPLEVPWETYYQIKSYTIQQSYVWNKPPRLLNVTKTHSGESIVNHGLYFDPKSDKFGKPFRKIKSKNFHNLNFRDISQNFLFPKSIQWQNLKILDINGHFEYLHTFEKNSDNYYGLFDKFHLISLFINERYFDFFYKDENETTFHYKGEHLYYKSDRKYITVIFNNGEFGKKTKGKLLYRCSFPAKIRFGAVDHFKIHRTCIIRVPDLPKCPICKIEMDTFWMRNYHFFNHFTISKGISGRYLLNRIPEKYHSKYACVKLECRNSDFGLSNNGIRYLKGSQGYISLFRVCKSGYKLEFINKNGHFFLILNKFSVNAATKEIYLNFEASNYKISQPDYKDIDSSMFIDYEDILKFFLEKVKIHIPYFLSDRNKTKNAKNIIQKREYVLSALQMNEATINPPKHISKSKKIRIKQTVTTKHLVSEIIEDILCKISSSISDIPELEVIQDIPELECVSTKQTMLDLVTSRNLDEIFLQRMVKISRSNQIKSKFKRKFISRSKY